MSHTGMMSHSSPLGATPIHGGANFSLYSHDAKGVELLFFDHEDSVRPSRIIHLNPYTNCTDH
jgi:isoamylase